MPWTATWRGRPFEESQRLSQHWHHFARSFQDSAKCALAAVVAHVLLRSNERFVHRHQNGLAKGLMFVQLQ